MNNNNDNNDGHTLDHFLDDDQDDYISHHHFVVVQKTATLYLERMRGFNHHLVAVVVNFDDFWWWSMVNDNRLNLKNNTKTHTYNYNDQLNIELMPWSKQSLFEDFWIGKMEKMWTNLPASLLLSVDCCELGCCDNGPGVPVEPFGDRTSSCKPCPYELSDCDGGRYI